MTYLGWHFDAATRRIVVMQDTLALTPFGKSGFMPLASMDKVYHHAPSNTLVGMQGSGAIAALAIGMYQAEQGPATYDEMVSETARLLNETFAEVAQVAIDLKRNVATSVVILGFKDSTPQYTILWLGADGKFSVANEGLVERSVALSVSNLSVSMIPDATADTHGESIALLDKLAVKANTGDQPAKHGWLALLAHLATCHEPNPGSRLWGRGIGGEFVAYSIGEEGVYEEEAFFTFPDNDMHDVNFERRLHWESLDCSKQLTEEDYESIEVKDLTTFLEYQAELFHDVIESMQTPNDAP